MRTHPPRRARQRGWAGLVALLVALLIVGFVFRSVLKQMGVSDGAASAQVASPARSAAAPPGASGASAAPVHAARAVEAEVTAAGKAAEQRLRSLDR